MSIFRQRHRQTTPPPRGSESRTVHSAGRHATCCAHLVAAWIVLFAAAVAPPAAFAEEPNGSTAKHQLHNAKDAAFIVVQASFRTTSVTVNGKPYPKNSQVGAVVAPGTHEVVVSDTKSEKSKRYRFTLKAGEARVLIVDLSGGSPGGAPRTSPTTTQVTPDQAVPDQAEEGKSGEGFLTVNATPSAQVYIDGKLVSSTTPLTKYAIMQGNHTVRVYYVELKKFSDTKRAQVKEGRHVNLYFNANQ